MKMKFGESLTGKDFEATCEKINSAIDLIEAALQRALTDSEKLNLQDPALVQEIKQKIENHEQVLRLLIEIRGSRDFEKQVLSGKVTISDNEEARLSAFVL